MKSQVESDHNSARGLYPTVWSKDDQDPEEVRRLELDVAEAAGGAARAAAITGAHMAVAGVGPIETIANWMLMSSPKALVSPQDVRSTAATVRGRLRAMLDEAEAARDTDLPAFAPAQLHPLVWSAAAAHWTAHQWRVAVREAAEALTIHWKPGASRSQRRQ